MPDTCPVIEDVTMQPATARSWMPWRSFKISMGDHDFGEGVCVALFKVVAWPGAAAEAFDGVFLLEVGGKIFGGAEEERAAGELARLEVELRIAGGG